MYAKLSFASATVSYIFCLQKGAKVVDTIAWTNVKELHKLAKGEKLSNLDWSNDDRLLVLACSNGSWHVINTMNWKVGKSFLPSSFLETGLVHTDNGATMPLVKKDCDLESGPSSFMKRNGTTRNEHIDVLEGDLSWHELTQVIHFIAVSEAFIDAHQWIDPAPALRNFLKCILMLTIHAKWVSARDDAVAIRISQADEGEPVIAVLRILGICTDIMKQAMRKRGDDQSESWTRFDLMPRDLRRIQVWNEQWLAVDTKASCIDIAMLQAADDASWVLPAPLHERERVTMQLSNAASDYEKSTRL